MTNDYDPDLDFEPLNVPPAGLRVSDIRDVASSRGNSLKAQMEEIWQAKGVCAVAHVAVWKAKKGRIIGYCYGNLLHSTKSRVPKRPSSRDKSK
jgi:hypothetical protein